MQKNLPPWKIILPDWRLERRGSGAEGMKEVDPLRKSSAVRFLTAKGEIRSSPARRTASEVSPAARPTEGNKRGRSAGGREREVLDRGLQRIRVLEGENSGRKQRIPFELAAG